MTTDHPPHINAEQKQRNAHRGRRFIFQYLNGAGRCEHNNYGLKFDHNPIGHKCHLGSVDPENNQLDGLTTSTIVTVLPTPMFCVTTGIKTLDFAWSAVSATSYYQLRSNPDGSSGYVDLSTTGMVVSPNSTNIRQTTAQDLVSL